MELLGWIYLAGGYGNAGMRPERRARSRKVAGWCETPRHRSLSGRKALNPGAVGTESPLKEAVFLLNSWSITEAVSILGIGISPKSRLL
jgi:hypothetical protein